MTLNFNLTAPGTNTYLIHVEAADNWNGYGYDLMIYEGAVEPSPFTQYHSLANGFYVDNSGGTGGITITNTNSRWNSNNSGRDIEIYSMGIVSLTKMELNDSGTGGLLISNHLATVGTPGVTLTGVNFNLNDGNGALIQTKGPVVVKDASLSQNWGFGYEIDNSLGIAATPVTFTNVNVDGYGAYDKGGSNPGIYIKSLGAITVTNTFSNGNASDGMYIKTNGGVTFKGVGARDNRGYGAYVITPGAFTINAPTVGTNDFMQNEGDGLIR